MSVRFGLPGFGRAIIWQRVCLWLVAVLFWGQALGQEPEPHQCATSRQTITPRLLADGITSKDHVALMRQYDMQGYKLDLALERGSLEVSGTVTLHAAAVVNSLSEFAFELHPAYTIQNVLLNGISCSVRRNGSEVVAVLPKLQNQNEAFQIQVTYAGTAPSGASAAIGNGFNTANTVWGPFAWSLSEPFAASEWFPCKQLLEDKADWVETWVTTRNSNKVGSNGLLQKITPLPNQKHRYEWKSNYPIAYYLISVALGPYEEYSFRVPLPGAAQPVLVQNYIYPGFLDIVKAEIDQTGPLLQTFSELYGLYPFHAEKYGHSMAPIGGGMEHQTMTTQSSFNFTLTAHELAHQWWGNEVTCADWSHIWLNEGFASYSEYLALERLKPTEKEFWLLTTHQSALNEPNGSVFVKDSTNVSRIFSSALTYRKGAMVLHMLRHALGSDEVFFKVLRAYRQQYQHKVAHTRNLQQVVERETGKSYAYFFDQWVYGEGFPVFDVEWAQQEGKIFMRSTQTGSSPVTPFFTTEVEYRITTTVKDTLIRVPQNKPVEEYAIKVPGTVTNVELDPHQWLLNTGTTRPNPEVLPAGPTVLMVYPNPSGSELYLAGGPGQPDEVQIYDMVGRLVRTVSATANPILVEDLRAGAYVLRLRHDQQITTLRFLKL